MIKAISAIVILSAISGCTAIPAAAIYSGSLKGVERVGALYIADTRPGVDVDAGTACLTGAMKKVEIVKLGSKDSRFLTPEYRAALDAVAMKPKAANCLAALDAPAA